MPDVAGRPRWFSPSMTFAQTEVRMESAGGHQLREGFVYLLLAGSCTTLATLGLLAWYLTRDRVSLDAAIVLWGGCDLAFCGGIAFALVAHGASKSRGARIAAIGVTTLNAVLFVAAGLFFLLLVGLSQVEFQIG
jgi:hypothetical protein